MSKALSRKQKGMVCQLARRAWDRWASDEWAADINDDVSDANLFRAWRTREQASAVGQHSLTTCLQTDFAPLMAHFARLAGDDKAEQYWTARMLEDPRNEVLHLLRTACHERGLAYPEYPAAISQRQFKCGLGGASPKQLWNLLYTVRNRRKAVAK